MINPSLDISELHRQFSEDGRIQIPDVLDPAVAERLFLCLDREVPWTLAYIDGEESVTVAHERLKNLDAHDGATIQQRIQHRARTRFQFMYNSYMMVEAYVEKRNPHLPLHRFLEFLNTQPFLNFVRAVTGVADIIKADAQATRYISGHFLKRHDDTREEEGRQVAYVLSLTRDWEADWGGLLQFMDANGNVIETFMPRYNALNLFKVPMDHCVSYVTPYARRPRYSITGWLRKHTL